MGFQIPWFLLFNVYSDFLALLGLAPTSEELRALRIDRENASLQSPLGRQTLDHTFKAYALWGSDEK